MVFTLQLPRTYLCYRAAEPPALDGNVESPGWRNAPWTEAFVDIEGDARPAPPLRTRAKMLWDNEYFYIGAQLEEPHVWATLTEHDAVIFHDNDFEVFIDPDGDNHNYYEIEINALNTVWDLRLVKPYRNGGPALNEWEIPGLQTAVEVDGTLNDPRDIDRSWSVVLAIPWRVLGEYAGCPVPPREGDQWRVNFSRVEWDVEIADGVYRKIPNRPEHNWVWSPQGVIDMHRPERWGYVQFTTATNAATGTNAAPGTASVRPDASAAARDYLMRVYHAQQAFKQQTGAWAATLADLALPAHPAAQPQHRPELSSSQDDFEAGVSYRADDDSERRLHVRADSRLWSTSEPEKDSTP